VRKPRPRSTTIITLTACGTLQMLTEFLVAGAEAALGVVMVVFGATALINALVIRAKAERLWRQRILEQEILRTGRQGSAVIVDVSRPYGRNYRYPDCRLTLQAHLPGLPPFTHHRTMMLRKSEWPHTGDLIDIAIDPHNPHSTIAVNTDPGYFHDGAQRLMIRTW
jgi:hypothetical protein